MKNYEHQENGGRKAGGGREEGRKEIGKERKGKGEREPSAWNFKS